MIIAPFLLSSPSVPVGSRLAAAPRCGRPLPRRALRISAFEAAASSSLYDVLGLSKCATSKEIKAAYRRLARSCHPDVVAAERRGASAEQFVRINAAYVTLADPERRKEYDRTSLWAAVSFPSSSSYAASSGSSGYSCRRSWETDQCW